VVPGDHDAVAAPTSALFWAIGDHARSVLLAGLLRGSYERHRDIDGLAGTGAVVDDTPLAAVQRDEAIQQPQAAAAFIVSGCLPPDRPASATVMDLHAQIAVGIGQPHPDRPIAVTHRVRDQFADDELGQVDMPAKPPARQRFARPLAGIADLRRILVKSESDGKNVDGGQRHSQLQARQ
jgi:hypothetical protein